MLNNSLDSIWVDLFCDSKYHSIALIKDISLEKESKYLTFYHRAVLASIYYHDLLFPLKVDEYKEKIRMEFSLYFIYISMYNYKTRF